MTAKIKRNIVSDFHNDSCDFISCLKHSIFVSIFI